MRFMIKAIAVTGVFLAPVAAQAGCTIYEHRDFNGSQYGLNGGDTLQMGGEKCGSTSTIGRMLYNRTWNDKVSSFTVSKNCTITLWEHVKGCGGGGAQFVRSGKRVSYIGGNWNDKVSFVECYCK